MPDMQAIFFDVGDTLVYDDPPRKNRFAMALDHAGLDVDIARLPAAWHAAERISLQAYLQGTMPEEPTVMRASAEAAVRALGLPLLMPRQWNAVRDAFLAQTFVRYVPPQAVDLLQNLKARGLHLGVISDWDETLPDVLKSMGLLSYLDSLSISAVVGAEKPDPRLFMDGLSKAGVSADAALHIGDWYELDVLGAYSVGMQALLFDTNRRAPDAPCPRVETFDALHAYLDPS